MLKGVLFDFDGVVVQSEKLHKRTFLELLKPYGVEISEERWYSEFAGTGSKHIFEVLTAEYGIKEDVDVLVVRRKKNYEDAVRNGELKETPGIEEFLRKLKQKKMKTAIVSGSHRSNVQAALDFFHLAKYFDLIVAGDELEKRKPDPEPYLYAARKLGLKPEECMVLEDSLAGAKSAMTAGMHLVMVTSPAKIPLPKGTVIIDDFKGFELPGG